MQENPSRVLKYRASHIHRYGWMPFIIWRNLRATVFSNSFMHFQSIVLCLWTLLLHLTGLSLDHEDLDSFVRLWGTAYLGQRESTKPMF